ALQSWFADFAEVDPREDGRFYAWWNSVYYASGLFQVVEENENLELTWHGLDEPHPTKVAVAFEKQGDGTKINLKHSGIGSNDDWIRTIEELSSGWKTSFENLKSVLETGLDKRLYDRPMLGIMPTQLLDEELSKELNLPISTGVIISDVVEGMGAEIAGLKKDDVIYSLNGKQLKVFQDFGLALSDNKAGDVVEVVFYRDGEKHSIDMTLSGRPIPEIPESAEDFSKRIASIYKQLDEELDAVLEGVNEEQASRRPAKEEWSAKEVIAHLIFNERWLHITITATIENYRPGVYTNDLGMHAALANAYSLPELVAEFKRCEAVTVEAVAALPDDFVADKRRYVPLVTLLGEQGYILHTRNHLPQIKMALEVAKDHS
ncbi:MAG: SRPBCC domain-containing protein, partial [Anaerolineales bacterium]